MTLGTVVEKKWHNQTTASPCMDGKHASGIAITASVITHTSIYYYTMVFRYSSTYTCTTRVLYMCTTPWYTCMQYWILLIPVWHTGSMLLEHSNTVPVHLLQSSSTILLLQYIHVYFNAQGTGHPKPQPQHHNTTIPVTPCMEHHRTTPWHRTTAQLARAEYTHHATLLYSIFNIVALMLLDSVLVTMHCTPNCKVSRDSLLTSDCVLLNNSISF